jgi:hypothetical protein
LNGTDTAKNIEKLQFTDRSINLSIQAKAATASISTAVLQNIEELYVGFFKRVPDADGLEFWIDQYKAGKTITQIADSFYDAGVQYSDITGYSSTMIDDEFITLVYANVLGRTGATAPSDGEVGYWADNLSNGLASRGSMVNAMLKSAHSYANDAEWSWVDKLLNNKTIVATKVAVEWGISYVDPNLSITEGMAIADAVTAIDTVAAIDLVGVSSLFA